jgi:hypothetical protein
MRAPRNGDRQNDGFQGEVEKVGLDTTHDAWHGAYSAFSRWRELIAVAAGYELAEFEDHGLPF